MDITKVVIPAAGLGTRFLPLTKSVPKEMIPLLNKPALHYVIEEGLASDINQFLLITSKNKEAIADYFDHNELLDQLLKETKKEALVSHLNKIIRSAHFTYIRQPEPLGLGHALTMARHAIGPKEYFGICLPDDIIVHSTPGLNQLIRVARQEKASIIAVQEIEGECISAYGVVAVKKQITPHLYQVSHVVEKPKKNEAPSNLAIVGRYVLSAKIFKALDEVEESGINGELQLTDGINQMINQSEKVFAYKIQGMRYDVGTPLGWIKTIIGMALHHPAYAPHIKQFLADLNSPESFVYKNIKAVNHTDISL